MFHKKKNGGESGIRTHGTCEGTHTFQACAENLGLIKQYLFNIKTSKIGLDCDQSESKFLTQIVVGLKIRKEKIIWHFVLHWVN